MRLIDADKIMIDYELEQATKYHNLDAEQQKFSYSTMFMYEIAEMIDDAPTVEAIPKDQYEQRLKADLVAMLEDLRLSIEGLGRGFDCDYAGDDCIRKWQVDEMLEERINVLKGTDNE